MVLKVLIVGPYPPQLGGTSAFISHLVTCLERADITCRVINTLRGDSTKGLFERVQRLVYFLRIAYKSCGSSYPIIHCHAVSSMNLLGHGIILSMARLCRIKAVLTLHGGDLFEMLTKRASIKHMVARWIVRLPHIITTVNPDLREAVCSLGVKSVRFIPNSLQDFIDYSRICTETPAELSRFVASHRPLIVSVGAMQSNYGIDVLIQSLDLVRDVYPEIGAIVVAFKSTDPIYRARIQRLMSRLSLDSAVMFPSSLPYVPSIVAQADLFVRPTFQDGDSISVREALELRIPVVASQIGFRPPGVILFRPGNIEDLAARIIDALSPYNPHTLLGLSREIDPAKAYMEIYRSLLKM